MESFNQNVIRHKACCSFRLTSRPVRLFLYPLLYRLVCRAAVNQLANAPHLCRLPQIMDSMADKENFPRHSEATVHGSYLFFRH